MNNAIVINSADFKFSQIVDAIQPNITSKYFGEPWLVKMNKLNEFIKENGAEDKVTLSDDRLVLSIFKALCKDIIVDAQLREWWIVRRYLELYADKKTIAGTTLFEWVDMYIGYNFSDAHKDENATKKFNELADILWENAIKLGGLKNEVPKFVIDAVTNKFKVEDATPEQERQEWQDQLDMATIMLDSDDLSSEERQEWQDTFDMAEIMLS
jgi:hypothetical protein